MQSPTLALAQGQRDSPDCFRSKSRLAASKHANTPGGLPLSDPFNLQRFLDAQDDVYAEVLAELRDGRKRSHWIWFIFPQIKGLGHSPEASYYGIGSLDEAAAYLRHPVLGPRLAECTGLLNKVEGSSIEEILGWPDHMKFRSSMTLFVCAAGDQSVFQVALKRYFDGEPDQPTLDILG
jgi:uncharacterized protein (DUF1810 family)